MKSPTRIGAIVANEPTLNRLLAKARALQEINTLVRGWLPGPLAQKVRVAVIRDGVLVLTADSAAWATRLRYEASNLLEKAREHPELSHLVTVQIRVDAG